MMDIHIKADYRTYIKIVELTVPKKFKQILNYFRTDPDLVVWVNSMPDENYKEAIKYNMFHLFLKSEKNVISFTFDKEDDADVFIDDYLIELFKWILEHHKRFIKLNIKEKKVKVTEYNNFKTYS